MTDPKLLITKFYDLNFGIYFDACEDLRWVKIFTSNSIHEEYNNHALVYSLTSGSESKLQTIENYLKKLNLTPAVYIAPFSKPQNISFRLEKEFGYSASYVDAWMIFDNNQNLSDWDSLEQVVHIGQDKQLFAEFEKISNLGYSGEKTSENPYGGIPMEGFITAAKLALSNSSLINRIEGYLVKIQSQYVACAILLHDREFGYICNVATIPSFRGHGFGKTISLYATGRSKYFGNKTTFLATESGTPNEKFYNNIGYRTEFIGSCYIKIKK